MNEYCFAEIEEGATETFSREVTAQMEDAFRMLCGDENPLHKEDDFAREAGNGRFKGHVTFGMLTASLYSTLAGVYLPGKYSLIHSVEVKFRKPVYAGDMLTVKGRVERKQEALKLLEVRAEISNQEGQCVSKADMEILVLK